MSDDLGLTGTRAGSTSTSRCLENFLTQTETLSSSGQCMVLNRMRQNLSTPTNLSHLQAHGKYGEMLYTHRTWTNIATLPYHPFIDLWPSAPTHVPLNQWPPTISTTGMTMMDIIELLPPEYKQAVGNASLPQDDGLALAKCLTSGQTIWAWSDGTVKHGDGAHAYTLRTRHNDPQECLKGSSMTPGDPKTICSLRTEHYGAFGIAYSPYHLYLTLHHRNHGVYNFSHRQ